jgi:hypothetical protein
MIVVCSPLSSCQYRVRPWRLFALALLLSWLLKGQARLPLPSSMRNSGDKLLWADFVVWCGFDVSVTSFLHLSIVVLFLTHFIYLLIFHAVDLLSALFHISRCELGYRSTGCSGRRHWSSLLAFDIEYSSIMQRLSMLCVKWVLMLSLLSTVQSKSPCSS